MDNCCDNMLKYLIFIFNFLFFMTGVALIAMGAYIQIEMKDYLNFFAQDYLNSSVLFIIVGVIIFIIGFFGCCGAYTENSCMMYTFSAFLAIIVVVEIGGAIAIYIFKNDAKEVVTAAMITGMENYDPNPDSEFAGVTQAWNLIQNDFQCCGVSNFSNWNAAKSLQGLDVPDSCCKTETTGCGKGRLGPGADLNNINQEGCFTKLEALIVDNVAVVGGIGIAIVVLQIVGVLVSCMLARNMRRRYSYV